MVLLFSIEFLTPLILEGCFHLECGFIGPEGNFCKMRGKPGILVCSLYPFWIMDFDWGVLCPAILVTGNWGVVGTGHVRVKGSCSARLSRTLHKSKRRETMSGLLLDFLAEYVSKSQYRIIFLYVGFDNKSNTEETPVIVAVCHQAPSVKHDLLFKFR